METNSKGWRDRPFNTETEKDFRTVVVGDSVSFGRRVNVSQTWVKQFETKINQSTDQDIEVLNLGSVGEDAKDKQETVENWALGYNPDLIILQLSQHDEQNRTRIDELREDYLTNISDPSESERNQAHDFALEKEEEERTKMSEKESMTVITESLDSIESEAEENVPLMVVGMEMREDQNRILDNISKDREWSYHSLSDEIRQLDYIIPEEGYYNEEGHKLIAEKVDSKLSEQIIDLASSS